MHDKEVGKLWSLCISTPDANLGLLRDMKRLIRKLVDERAYAQYVNESHQDAIMHTLRDFGIDPKKFNP
jgi:hypothetical protein